MELVSTGSLRPFNFLQNPMPRAALGPCAGETVLKAKHPPLQEAGPTPWEAWFRQWELGWVWFLCWGGLFYRKNVWPPGGSGTIHCVKRRARLKVIEYTLWPLGFPGGQESKESACNTRDPGSIPVLWRPLKKEMAAHSSIRAYSIPRTEEAGGLQSTGLQRVGHDWAIGSTPWEEGWGSDIQRTFHWPLRPVVNTVTNGGLYKGW